MNHHIYDPAIIVPGKQPLIPLGSRLGDTPRLVWSANGILTTKFSPNIDIISLPGTFSTLYDSSVNYNPTKWLFRHNTDSYMTIEK